MDGAAAEPAGAAPPARLLLQRPAGAGPAGVGRAPRGPQGRRVVPPPAAATGAVAAGDATAARVPRAAHGPLRTR